MAKKKKKSVGGRPENWQLICMRRNPPPGWVDPEEPKEEKSEEKQEDST